MRILSSLPLVLAAAGCALTSEPEPIGATQESALDTYDAARGNRIADRALALWNGRPSRNLCLAGVGDTLESSGAASPAFPRLPSAVAFDDWARANPGEIARRGFARTTLPIDQIPRGSIITWRPGQCGYHAQYGHVEIVTGAMRACSDYCGAIKTGCGAPGILVPVGAGGGGGGDACAVQGDAKLHCSNGAGAPLRAEPRNGAPVVDALRTTYSWFECWAPGDRHAGGNTTWYRTVGDDRGARGWVAGSDLRTPDAFDADPSARGLARCN